MCFPVIVQLGETPLIQASLGGHEKVVEVLLTAGADVNFVDKVSYGLKLLPNYVRRYKRINFKYPSFSQNPNFVFYTIILIAKHIF